MSDADDDVTVTKGYFREELRRELGALEKRMIVGVAAEMARQANVIIEQIGSRIAVVDEKYADVPTRLTSLEQRMEAHARDSSLHTEPPAPRRATKRPKRSR